MQKSKRLIRYTILALGGIAVLYVGVNRLYAIGDPAVQRTPPGELATLRDFDEIEVIGDFGVDIVQGADYSIAFAAPDAGQGNFVATVRGGTLVLRGFHNASANRVRVALPEMTRLQASSVSALTISGFHGESLSLRLDGAAQVVLRDNDIRRWHIAAVDVDELRVDHASIMSGRFHLTGELTLSVVD